MPLALKGSAAARGAYLASEGNCQACHSAPGGTPYAGGLAFETPFGIVYSSNITPDPKTVIGSWDEGAFVEAMQQGVRPNGEHLYPVFPYTHFTKVTRDDLSALYDYLMALPPAPRANGAHP